MNFKDYCKKVGLSVQQMFTPLISIDYGATRVFKGRKYKGIQHRIKSVVLHTTGNKASAKNEALNIHNNAGINSFHGVVDKHGVYETVRFSDTAHHAGDHIVNLESLGFELTDDNAAGGYDNYVKYIGYVLYQLGITPNHNTIKFHNEIVKTSCGAYLRNKGKDQIIKDLNKYIAIAKGSESKPEFKPKPQPKPDPKPTPKPQPSSVIKKGDLVRYVGYVYADSLGSRRGVHVNGHYKATIVNNNKFGVHLDNLGWAEKSKVTKVNNTASKKIAVGDNVAVVNNVQYNGGRFAVHHKSYEVFEVVGDRVVVGRRQGRKKVVIAAVNVNNLKLV